MNATQIAQYVWWAQIGLAVLIVVLALLGAVRASRPRYLRAAAVAAPALSAAVIVVASVIGGFGLAPVAAGVAVLAGAAVGFLAGRSARFGEHQGKRVVKPSPAVAWVNALAVALLALGIALVGPNTASLMAAVALGTAAMALVESAVHLSRAGAVR